MCFNHQYVSNAIPLIQCISVHLYKFCPEMKTGQFCYRDAQKSILMFVWRLAGKKIDKIPSSFYFFMNLTFYPFEIHTKKSWIVQVSKNFGLKITMDRCNGAKTLQNSREMASIKRIKIWDDDADFIGFLPILTEIVCKSYIQMRTGMLFPARLIYLNFIIQIFFGENHSISDQQYRPFLRKNGKRSSFFFQTMCFFRDGHGMLRNHTEA